MRCFTLPLLLSLVFLATPAAALTLEKTLQAALNNHQKIVQFRANAERSQAAVVNARSAFLPSVDLSYSYLNQDQNPNQLGNETSTLSLSSSLNLFNGMADYHSYQAAKHRSSGANYQLQGVLADIALAAKQAYIEVLRADRSVGTENQGVELLQRQKRDAELRFKHGLIARNDLLRVEVELSGARQDLLRAKGNSRTARRQLERVTGLTLTPEEPLEEENEPPLITFDLTQADVYKREMLEKRSELNYLRAFTAAAQQEKSASKGSYLPDLDLIAAHEKYGDSLSPSGRDDSYDEDSKLMLNARWNLFNGFSDRSAVADADAKVRASAAELRDTESALLLQLEIALNEARVAAGQLEEAQIGVTQAEENYRVTNNRYQQQQATTVDLLDAQYLLTRSRNLQINAHYDLYLATAALERILERTPLRH